MIIQGVQQYQAYEMQIRLHKKQAVGNSVKSEKRTEDSYNMEKSTDRKTYLDSIKKKIKSGFYNSDEVAEDLSQSFAQVFDKSL